MAGRFQISLRCDKAVFCTGNLIENRFVGQNLVLNSQRALTFFHEPFGIICVIDGEPAGITQPIAELAQESGAGRMKSGDVYKRQW